jgi:YfiH family protein
VNPIEPFIEPDWPAPPGVLALCTTRVGGCSLPPYDSFNLAHHVGDEHANLERNRALLASRLPQGTTVQWLNQVHGVQVIKASGIGKPLYPEADAAWSDEPGVACAVMTADCLPVLFCSLDGKHVAAAHAGWRGLLAGVLEAAVTALDTEPDQLMSWLGPAIGRGAFEVGPEVREGLLRVASPSRRDAIAACFSPSANRPGHHYADLYALARLRLQSVGVSRIFGSAYCTFSERERFFSYRRDGQTGRMASLVMIRRTP